MLSFLLALLHCCLRLCCPRMPSNLPPHGRPSPSQLPTSPWHPAQAHVTYKVITRSSAPGFRPQAEVIRRCRDVVWLQRRLRREYRGESIGCRVVLLLCSAI